MNVFGVHYVNFQIINKIFIFKKTTYSMVTSLCINETSKDTRMSLGIWGRVYRIL